MMLIVPSRGRPSRAHEMAMSARLTAQKADELEIVIVIDDTDPELDWYRDTFEPEGRTRLLTLDGRHRYTQALNDVAFTDAAREHDILGAFGDDVLFRTGGWDRIVRKTLRRPGIAYGDDLIHGRNHPTAVFMSRAIVDALGWLALPATKHQWADDGWKQLGLRAGCLRFMSGVVLEHMHPAVGKAEWDDTYRAVIGGEEPGAAKADYDGFSAWLRNDLETDASKARAAR